MKTPIRTSLVVAAALALSACAGIAPTKQVVDTRAAPTAIGPYSQAIRHGSLLFLSGQIPIDVATNAIPAAATIEDQTKLVIEHLRAVLAANGMTLDNVVSTQVFMKDLNEFSRMNQVYGMYFKDAPPARATVEVARLPRDVKVEIAAIAIKN